MDPAGQNVLGASLTVHPGRGAAWSFDNKRWRSSAPRVNAANWTWRDIYIVNARRQQRARADPPGRPFELHRAGRRTVRSLAVSMSLNGVTTSLPDPRPGQSAAYSTGYGGLPGTLADVHKSGQVVYLGPTRKTVNRINGNGSGNKILFTSTRSLFSRRCRPTARSSCSFDWSMSCSTRRLPETEPPARSRG